MDQNNFHQQYQAQKAKNQVAFQNAQRSVSALPDGEMKNRLKELLVDLRVGQRTLDQEALPDQTKE